MHAGGHHLHTGGQARGHHSRIAISSGYFYFLGTHGAGGGVIYPDGGAIALLEQCGGG